MMDKLVRWLRSKKIGTTIKLQDFMAEIMGMVFMRGTLSARVFRVNGDVEDRGIISIKVVTDDFVEALVDTLQSSVAAFSDFKYHDSGEGIVGEDPTDSGLGSPCGEARDIGTQIEGATANIYKSVATHTYAGSFSITEHGWFNSPAAGILGDRSVFTGANAINVSLGDRVEWTYQLTCVSGG